MHLAPPADRLLQAAGTLCREGRLLAGQAPLEPARLNARFAELEALLRTAGYHGEEFTQVRSMACGEWAGPLEPDRSRGWRVGAVRRGSASGHAMDQPASFECVRGGVAANWSRSQRSISTSLKRRGS